MQQVQGSDSGFQQQKINREDRQSNQQSRGESLTERKEEDPLFPAAQVFGP